MKYTEVQRMRKEAARGPISFGGSVRSAGGSMRASVQQAFSNAMSSGGGRSSYAAPRPAAPGYRRSSAANSNTTGNNGQAGSTVSQPKLPPNVKPATEKGSTRTHTGFSGTVTNANGTTGSWFFTKPLSGNPAATRTYAPVQTPSNAAPNYLSSPNAYASWHARNYGGAYRYPRYPDNV